MKKLFILLLSLSLVVPAFASDKDDDETEKPKYESLEEAVLDIVEKAMMGIEKAGDFVVENAPEVIKQYLQWKLFEHTFYISIPLLTFFILLFVFFMTTRKWNKEKDGIDGVDGDCEVSLFGRYTEWDDIHWSSFLPVVMLINVIVFVIVFCVNILPIIQIVFAPYVYLMETVINKL